MSSLAVVATNYPPHQGGVEQHLAGLVPRLVARGIRCTVVCLGDEPGEREVEGVSIVTLRRRLDIGGVLALPTASDWRRTRQRLSVEGITHVATHTRFFPMSLLGVRLARQLGVPSVHTEHGAGFVRTGRFAVDAAAEIVDRTMGRRVLRDATEVLAVSRRSADFVTVLSGRTAEVIGNGVELALWAEARVPPSDQTPRARLVFAGRMAPEKGWADFLQVVASVRDVPGLDAVIAGNGDLDAVRREADRLDVADIVRIAGPLSTEDLARELSGAVYVNPSRASEGFQLTQMEAAAAGAQVVTYDVGIARELAGAPGVPITVVPVGEVAALAAAVADALIRPRPQAPLESLTRWDWSAVVDRYIAALQRVSTPG